MNRLQGKDLINIGIFTAIYFIVIFAAASIGFIPIFIPLISVIVPLVGGIPMMLFFSKIKKFGMLTICGLLLGVIMLLTGMGYWCIPTGLIFGLISDFMMKGCGYKNAKREVLIHGANFSKSTLNGRALYHEPRTSCQSEKPQWDCFRSSHKIGGADHHSRFHFGRLV